MQTSHISMKHDDNAIQRSQHADASLLSALVPWRCCLYSLIRLAAAAAAARAPAVIVALRCGPAGFVDLPSANIISFCSSV